MAIDVKCMVQYNDGFLPDIILFILLFYYHRGTKLNATWRVLSSLQSMFPSKRFDNFSPCLRDAQKV